MTDEEMAQLIAEGPAGVEPGIDLGALGAALAAKADADGLLELAWSSIDSPLGPLFVAGTDRGIVQIGFVGVPDEERVERLASVVGPRVMQLPARFDPLRTQLDEYFHGRRTGFDLPLDWRLTSGFVRKVLRATARIPYGQTRSYADVARSAGSPRAFRAAGSALGANPIPIVVPCHRVLRSGGALGGYGGGLPAKRTLLALEGVSTG